MSAVSETFADRTVVISGASRGIGLAIALATARRGANIVLLAKTAEPHPKSPPIRPTNLPSRSSI